MPEPAFAETVYRETKGPEKLAEADKYLEERAWAAGLNYLRVGLGGD